MRSFAFALSFVVAYGSAPLGFNVVLPELGGMVRAILAVQPGPYTDAPGPVFKGKRPGKDPSAGRGSDPKRLADLKSSR